MTATGITRRYQALRMSAPAKALRSRPDATRGRGPIKNDSAEAHRLEMDLIHNGVVPEHMKAEPDGRYSYTEYG